MNTTAAAIRDLARRLTALEGGHAPSGEAAGAEQACEKLRAPLVRLAGVAGFRSLMTRSKALATAEAPWLESVVVRFDGSLEGFNDARLRHGVADGAEAAVAIVAQLLGLLVTFIGEPLTLQIVRDAWPDAETGVPS